MYDVTVVTDVPGAGRATDEEELKREVMIEQGEAATQFI